MNKKKLTGIIVAGVVVIACITLGIGFHNKNKVTEASAFSHLINKDYTSSLTTTKDDGKFNYELNVEGSLTKEEVQDIAIKAKQVAKNSNQIIVNYLNDNTNEKDFNGFFSDCLKNKAIIEKDGTGKIISFEKLNSKDENQKGLKVSKYSSNKEEKLDSTNLLKITIDTDKLEDVSKEGIALNKTIKKLNGLEKSKNLVIDFSNKDNSAGVIIDNNNPELEGVYSSFKA